MEEQELLEFEATSEAGEKDPAENAETPSKRKSISNDAVSATTVERWAVSGAVNVSFAFGFGLGCTPAHRLCAEHLLSKNGMLVCTLCTTAVSANKKSMNRHADKNQLHIRYAAEHAAGIFEPNLEAAMAYAEQYISEGPIAEHRTKKERLSGLPTSTAIFSAITASSQSITHPTTATTASVGSARSEDLEEGWQILMHDGKVQDRDALTTILSDLGICESRDLLLCDKAELLNINGTLKKIPQRRFSQIFSLDSVSSAV